MSEPIDVRRRRAAYRAAHRGTKEMDLMLGGYARAELEGMDEPALALFEQFLALPDPEIDHWLLRGDRLPGEAFAGLVNEIRRFHGLPPLAAGGD
jgi:antitoxin CptB